MFADRLRDARKAKRYSQTEVSRMLGVTQQAVGKWETGRSTPDPQTVARLAEILDTTADALLGLQQADGVASVLIGLVLAATAYFLAVETKGLLMGEPALPRVRRLIMDAAQGEPGIRAINGVITSQQGPHTVVAGMSVEFDDAMTAVEIERCIERIEAKLWQTAPDVVSLFVKPQTPQAWAERLRRRRERHVEGAG